MPKSTKYMIYKHNLGKNVSDMNMIHKGFSTIVDDYSK